MKSALACVMAAAATVAALSGCGSDQPVGAVNVAESYLHDLGNGAYDAACGLFTDQLRRQLGDCAQVVRRIAGSLPVGERDELRYVRVHKATYHGDNQAQVYPADVTADATPAPTATGKAKPRRTAVRSIAANHALDGAALTLQKVGGAWQISGGPQNLHA